MVKPITSYKGERAQGMVEFALTLPIFLLLVVGVLEFGHLMSVYASFFTAAREGARYGSASGNYRDCNGIIAAANGIAVIAKPLTVRIGYDDAGTYTNNQDPTSFAANHQCGGFTINPNATAIPQIIVKVTANFGFIVLPFHSFPLSSQSARTIIFNVQYAETPVPIGQPTATSTITPTATLTPTLTLTPTITFTPLVVSTHLPYCLFLNAGAGSLSTNAQHSPQNFSFPINNSSTNPFVSVKLNRFTIYWSGGNNGHPIKLTEIDFQSYQFYPSLPLPESPRSTAYDTGLISNGPVMASPSVTQYFMFSSDNYDVSVNGSDVVVYMTYNDPGTNEVVNCKVSPGQTASKVP